MTKERVVTAGPDRPGLDDDAERALRTAWVAEAVAVVGELSQGPPRHRSCRAARSTAAPWLGEVVCAPGVEDVTLLDAVRTADPAAFAGWSPQPAARYRTG